MPIHILILALLALTRASQAPSPPNVSSALMGEQALNAALPLARQTGQSPQSSLPPGLGSNVSVSLHSTNPQSAKSYAKHSKQTLTKDGLDSMKIPNSSQQTADLTQSSKSSRTELSPNENEFSNSKSGREGSPPMVNESSVTSQGRQTTTSVPKRSGQPADDEHFSRSFSEVTPANQTALAVQSDARSPYRHGGQKSKKGGKKDRRRPAFWSGDIQIGCRELRARRYITDGFCTSEKPIKEVVCAGNCLPIMDMPWYAEFVKTLARTKLREWQCVEDIVRKKRVRLLCQNGELRFYRIKVVKSCKCKKVVRKHNQTDYGYKKKRKRRKNRKNRKRKGRKNKKGRVS